MKLLYVSTLDHIIHVMLPHLDAARARGWQVDVACNVTRDPKITEAHCDTLHSIPFARNPLHPKNLIATIKLIQLIRKEKYTIVHCHNPSGGFYGRLAATLSGMKCLRIYTAHGFHFHPEGRRFANKIYRYIERMAGRYLSDAVLVINQWDFEEAKAIMLSELVYKTPGVGVSTDFFDPAHVTEEQREKIRKEFGVGPDGCLIVSIGELIPRKGQEDILNLASALKHRGLKGRRTGVPVLIGKGKLTEILKKKSQEMNVQETLVLAGFRTDIREILAATDIFYFPSVQEGLPCVVQEALSMELPCVAFDVRGCKDLIDDFCGILVEYKTKIDDGSMYDGHEIIPSLSGYAVQLLKMSAEQRKEMGRAGRKKMIELYDRPKCVEEVLKIYDQLLEEKK
jgi:glycosyltransferase involved in cell wall biosynthesis